MSPEPLKGESNKFDGKKLKSQLVESKKRAKEYASLATKYKGLVKESGEVVSKLESRIESYHAMVEELKGQNEMLIAGECGSDLYDYVSDDGRFGIQSTYFTSDACPAVSDNINYRVIDMNSGASQIARYEDSVVNIDGLDNVPDDIYVYVRAAIKISNRTKK